ncbi:MAG: hypothetical protein HOG95_06135, partial [Rhodospirillaceae bacterium]|nr:hypothetical protein [Rhodospirillaceae bacterium]
MGSTSSRKKTDLIKKIIAATKAVSKRKPSARQEKFIRQFFANSPLHDLDERKLDTLAGVASSAWNLAQKRKPGETKIRVSNPTKSTDGWDSDRTLIEVVMEDMPFLVDSVTANLAQSGITVLQVTHPILRSERGKDGSLKEILSKETSDVPISVEAVMSFEVTQLTPAARLKDLLSQMKSVLNDVRAAVEDWQPVRT